MEKNKLTLPQLQRKADQNVPITMITCYDYSMAHLVARADIDMILVGDSLGMTMLGYESTLPVTMADMVRHGRAVRRGAPNSFLVVDMPYMSYQPSVQVAITNAGTLMAQAGCDAVKLEGGSRSGVDRVRAITDVGIPVMGHLGLTPQSASALGGFRVQGKKASAASRILDQAQDLESAGATSILLELIPDQLCELVRDQISIPVIGLGSGPHADGQLLIFHDLFGLYPDFKPRMAKQYQDVASVLLAGLSSYAEEVRSGSFPSDDHFFTMSENELDTLTRRSGDAEAFEAKA